MFCKFELKLIDSLLSSLPLVHDLPYTVRNLRSATAERGRSSSELEVRRCEVGDEPRSSEEIQASRRGSRPRKNFRLWYDEKLEVVKGRKVCAAASVALMLIL